MMTMKKMITMIRTYSELSKLQTFKERFRYLKLGNVVGETTFGFDRYLNQMFYKSQEWRKLRDQIIIRDNGCDLGIDGNDIFGKVIIHHMNPITKSDIIHKSDNLINSEYLICVSHRTHNAIHYGDESILYEPFVERTKNDTCPWR